VKRLKEAIPQFEAEMLREILANEGIEAKIIPTRVAFRDSVYFGIGAVVDLAVQDADYEKASEILVHISDEGGAEDERSEEDSPS